MLNLQRGLFGADGSEPEWFSYGTYNLGHIKWVIDQYKVEREQFFLGVYAKEPTVWLRLNSLHCHLMTSGGGIFPSKCESMLLSQAIPCYIFLHSLPPVLSFTLSKEQE
jgi:hypothetical protein